MLEYGVVEHQGKRFQAMGASCDGRHLTGYVGKHLSGRVAITDWQGRDLIETRVLHGDEFIVNDFRDTGNTLLLLLRHGHYVGGLSLGDGMLFRGEHFTADNAEEAMQIADSIAGNMATRDYEDFLQDQYEQSIESEEA